MDKYREMLVWLVVDSVRGQQRDPSVLRVQTRRRAPIVGRLRLRLHPHQTRPTHPQIPAAAQRAAQGGNLVTSLLTCYVLTQIILILFRFRTPKTRTVTSRIWCRRSASWRKSQPKSTSTSEERSWVTLPAFALVQALFHCCCNTMLLEQKYMVVMHATCMHDVQYM